MTEGTIYAALQKAKSEVHHFEHEVDIQKEASAKAEQAGRNLAQSLSEFHSEAEAHKEARASKPLKELNKPKQKILHH